MPGKNLYVKCTPDKYKLNPQVYDTMSRNEKETDSDNTCVESSQLDPQVREIRTSYRYTETEDEIEIRYFHLKSGNFFYRLHLDLGSVEDFTGN